MRRLFVAVGGEYGAESLLIVLLTLTALDGGPGGVAASLMGGYGMKYIGLGSRKPAST